MQTNIIKTVSISDILSNRISNKRKHLPEVDNSTTSLDDEESVQNLIRTISQNTLSSTHRMFEYCDVSEAYGMNVSKKLVEQDEKLKNIENGLEKINQNLSDVENNLDSLKKKGYIPLFLFVLEVLFECFCCCCCWCYSKAPGDESALGSISEKKGRFGVISKIKSRLRKKNKNKSDSVVFSAASSQENASKNSKTEDDDDDDSFLSSRFESKLKLKNLYDQPAKQESSHMSLALRHTSFDKSIMDLNGRLNSNLKFLDTKLSNLQLMVNDIGKELNKQSSKIEVATNKTVLNKTKAIKANEKGKKLL